MKAGVPNGSTRSPQVVSGRRVPANVGFDPADAGTPPTQRSPKNVNDQGQFQRLLLPAEQLEIDTNNFIASCK